MVKRENCILLVEDNPDDVELTLLVFKKNNFLNEVKVVEDGGRAINFLDEDKRIPVVILTSSQEEEDIIKRI